MSDTQRVKITIEFLDKDSRWTNHRILVFTGELTLTGKKVKGYINPLYNEGQFIQVEGQVDLATSQIDLALLGPKDPNHRPWDPEETYMWSVSHDDHMGWYKLPDRLVGQLTQTSPGVWMGQVDRNSGHAEVQLNLS